MFKNFQIWPLIKKKWGINKWPSKMQWKQLPSLFSKKEWYFIYVLLGLIIISSIVWGISSYLENTTIGPDYGGKYKEGIIGALRYINPLLSQTNDADRDISEIVFSGLTKYDGRGNLILDLAENYEIKNDGKTYDFSLKKNVKWHDGHNFTADDVVFTIQTIQNPDYKSPLRFNWTGVETEKIDDFTVRFELKNAYAPFLANTTAGIIPKHIWENVASHDFLLAEENLKAVGTGPYKIKKIKKDRNDNINSIILEANKGHHLKKPFIKKIILYFYPDEEKLIKALNKGKVQGISFVSAKNKYELKKSDKITIHSLNLPRYFAVFFNQTKNTALSDKTVRLALNYATNKQEIIDKILDGSGTPVHTPIPPGLLGYNPDTKIYDFALEHANNILEAKGWEDEDGDGIREKKIKKEMVPLEITLITTEWPELKEVAEILKEQWSKIGAKINLEAPRIAEIQQEYIIPRNYQALLFGEVLGPDPDPFSFWHSSQKRDPGLNLALYDNKNVDKLLEDARQILNSEIRARKYRKFQELIVEDVPVVFLYNPTYLYPVNKKIKGIEVENMVVPSERFGQIENWYIRTKRVGK